jgi:hypothetical protein
VKFKASNTTLSNRKNNIVDPITGLAKSKVLVDPLLGGSLEEERKIDPHIFQVPSKISFKRLFFRALLKMLLARPMNPTK